MQKSGAACGGRVRSTQEFTGTGKSERLLSESSTTKIRTQAPSANGTHSPAVRFPWALVWIRLWPRELQVHLTKAASWTGSTKGLAASGWLTQGPGCSWRPYENISSATPWNGMGRGHYYSLDVMLDTWLKSYTLQTRYKHVANQQLIALSLSKSYSNH